MREIKFRAWDGELMHGVGELHFCQGPKLDGKGIRFFGQGVGGGWIDGENVVLMQYTGLKDKNGKEIYEGDIGYTLIGRYSDPKHLFLSVVKCDRCFWEFYEKERDTPHEIWPNDQFEIIGNIYEHPHLLEGRDEA